MNNQPRQVPIDPRANGVHAGRPVPAGAGARAAGAATGGRNPNAPVPVSSRPIPVQNSGRANTSTDDEGEEGEDRLWKDFFKEAPAWLVSASFHTFVLIILGVWAAVAATTHKVEEVEISAEPMRYAETLGDQLTDPSVTEGAGNKDMIDPTADKQILTAQNMQPVDDPFAAPMPATDISLNGKWAASDIQAPSIGLALTGRQVGSRTALLGKYGGNALTEDSVKKGLEWLAKQQKADGLWSLTGPYPDGATEENVASATAMALLAFQGQGHTHRTGTYTKVVKKGWDALIKQQSKDGDFVRNASQHQKLYAQAQCTIALCELYGMTGDSLYRGPAELAVKYAIKAQDPSGGGWRYTPGQDSDTSVTGWYVMALQSAKMGKLDVPQETLDKVSRYLDSVATPDGKYTYTVGTFSTPAVTAEGYLCREYLGWKQNDQRLIDGVTALNSNRVNYNAPDRDVYYWYYATQACHHMEGDIWNTWNNAMKQEVPSHQVKNGNNAGSWDPAGDKWGTTGGRLYVTCLSTYMLEVYYRHLPLYSGYRGAPPPK